MIWTTEQKKELALEPKELGANINLVWKCLI